MKILFATDGSAHALVALATLMLGSVSAKVLAEAPVPVLLLR